ncbi:MAG: hypothetical protein Q7R69_00490 [bacterium]|nr:hypothetical protein [bacterium]
MSISSAVFITQSVDVVTIREGEVPVISTNTVAHREMAVNFLRCGCPAVQIELETATGESDLTWHMKLTRTLNRIALEGEAFSVKMNFPTAVITRSKT